MLTLAVAWFLVKREFDHGTPLLFSIMGDCSIVYWIARAAMHHG